MQVHDRTLIFKASGVGERCALLACSGVYEWRLHAAGSGYGMRLNAVLYPVRELRGAGFPIVQMI
jgi:hypothetical protein